MEGQGVWIPGMALPTKEGGANRVITNHLALRPQLDSTRGRFLGGKINADCALGGIVFRLGNLSRGKIDVP
jgi:hypothetical protein